MNYKDKFLRYFLIFKNKIRRKLLNFYFSFFLENFKNDSNTDDIESFINSENKQSKNIINLNILEEKNNFFPFLISNNFLFRTVDVYSVFVFIRIVINYKHFLFRRNIKLIIQFIFNVKYVNIV